MSTTSLPRSEAEAATIRKPLPEDLFVHHDTNAEMRWESVRPDEALTPQDRLFVRNHTETPVIDVDVLVAAHPRERSRSPPRASRCRTPISGRCRPPS